MPSKDEKAAKADPEQAQLAELYALMQSEGLDSLELKDENTSIRLIRKHAAGPVVQMAAPAPSPSAPAPAAAPAAAPSAEEAGDTINSPLAGVFYRASSPSTPAFAKEGDVVDPGQTLCIVEAMKVMNEIKAESRCKIVKILVENSRPVNAGQALFQVENA